MGRRTRPSTPPSSSSPTTSASRWRRRAARPSPSSPTASSRRWSRPRQAAGGKDVALGGGADVAQQYLAAGLIDELDLNVVPILLGDGARLFENLGGADLRLEQVRVIEAPGVTHIKYRVSA